MLGEYQVYFAGFVGTVDGGEGVDFDGESGTLGKG